MKTICRISVGVAVATGAACCFTAPFANADIQPSPDSVTSQSRLTEREKNLAKSHGVDPDSAEKESRNGLTMLSDSDSWVVVPADSNESKKEIRAMSFSAGICQGSFYDVHLVKGILEWGAQSTCVSAEPNDVYPHSVVAMLRQGNTNSIKMYNKGAAKSPSSSLYSKTASAHRSKKCVDNNTHKFNMSVTVTVHGTKFGPKNSPEVKLACGVDSD